jgi:CheY-like chemotaxis protein
MSFGAFTRELKILHIEDDAVETMNLRRIFRKLNVGHELLAATNGEDALSKLRESRDDMPHLVLLDLHMPLMGGLEFLEILRSDPQFVTMPVYVLTSSDLPQDKSRAAQYGVKRYVVKPFTPEKYDEVILDLLHAWEATEFARPL